MSASRREFLEYSLMSGGLAGLVGNGAAGRGFTERLLAAVAQAGDGGPAIGAHDSKNFWDSFGAVADAANAPPGIRGRGLKASPGANTGAADLARQIDFFHYTKDKTLRYASSIEVTELMDHPGDVTASVNVSGFRMAGEDRDQFAKLQSAQLRIDVLQSKSLMEYLDPMAWTSLAALFPDKSGKLPPLQDLSFDPATSWEKMQKIVLPGGSGQWAVNLSMAHKESQFLTIMKSLTTEVAKFSPVLGLPAISITALKGFCTLYGALEQRTTFLLNSFPQRAFATQLAREEAATQQGLNLISGDYVLVPHVYTEQLTPYLDKLELRQGYLVPKGSPATSSIIDLAMNLKPDITYLSTTIGLKPLTPAASSTTKAQPDGGDGSSTDQSAGKGSKGSGSGTKPPASSGKKGP